MSVINILSIAASGMTAESVRLNTTASNIANAEDVASSAETAYKPRYAVFEAMRQDAMQSIAGEDNHGGVKVVDVIKSTVAPRMEFQPDNPLSDEKGYVYRPDINIMSQMADMMSASRAYQMDVEMINAAKQMLQRTLSIGD